MLVEEGLDKCVEGHALTEEIRIQDAQQLSLGIPLAGEASHLGPAALGGAVPVCPGSVRVSEHGASLASPQPETSLSEPACSVVASSLRHPSSQASISLHRNRTGRTFLPIRKPGSSPER